MLYDWPPPTQCWYLAYYCPDPLDPAARNFVIDRYADYLTRYREHLKWFVRSGSPWRELTDRSAQNPIKRYRDPAAKYKAWVATGGASEGSADAWLVLSAFCEELPENPADFNANAESYRTLPMAERTPPQLVAQVLEEARAQPICQAYVGAALSGHASATRWAPEEQHLIGTTCLRFRGIDLPVKADYHATTALCPPSWLTILGPPFLDKLGGAKAFHNLGSDVVVHDLKTCILIQDGPEPQGGDLNKGETMESRRRIAKVMSPLIYDGKYAGSYSNSSRQFVIDYYRRFEAPADQPWSTLSLSS